MGLLRKKQTQRPARRRLAHSEGVSSAPDQYTFRRNRTLTGSLASHVESAGEDGAELRSKRLRTHDLHAHRRRLSLYLFTSVCVVLVLGWIIYQSIAAVRVTADTKQLIDQSLYGRMIQDYLVANPLQRLRPTLNTTALAVYLQTHGAPEVASVSSRLSYEEFGTSGIQLVLRKPVVVWKTGGTKLYVDGEGNAFSRNYYDDPSVEVVDQTGIQAQDNQVLASERFLGTIGRIIGKMRAQGYVVTRVILPVNTTHQLLISTEGLSYAIKFSVDRSVGEQVEDASHAIKYMQEKGITPGYIDVRVSGKAFYK